MCPALASLTNNQLFGNGYVECNTKDGSIAANY
jgi:hypothetical protein